MYALQYQIQWNKLSIVVSWSAETHTQILQYNTQEIIDKKDMLSLK